MELRVLPPPPPPPLFSQCESHGRLSALAVRKMGITGEIDTFVEKTEHLYLFVFRYIVCVCIACFIVYYFDLSIDFYDV